MTQTGKLRIAFCVLKGIRYSGGIERYTLELGSRLSARGHEITVYCMGRYAELSRLPGGMRIVQLPTLPVSNAEKTTAALAAALHILVRGRFDVVHFHHVSSGWAAFCARARGIPCILQSHGIAWRTAKWGTLGAMVLRLLERFAIDQCDVLTGVSRTQTGYYLSKYGKEMVYIPTGAAVTTRVAPHYIRQWGLASGSYVLCVGRLSPEKGFHHLIAAFRKLNTGLKLVIAGPEAAPRYTIELRDLAAGDPNIMFVGSVGGAVLSELYSNARVYVQPSELEGLSMALLEAMSYGNCCLVSDIPENIEAIGDAGWRFKSGCVESLGARLGWLLEHPMEATAVGANARRRVRAHYSWEAIVSQFETLYHRARRRGCERSRRTNQPALRGVIRGQN